MNEQKYIKQVSYEHRKKYAQFFTPEDIADFLVSWVLGENANNLEILEPAFGLGLFTRKIRKISKNHTITAYDIDNVILDFAKEVHKGDKNLNIKNSDYMHSSWEKKYDGIICNPPYFKFHDYDNTNLVNVVNKKLSLKLTKFTNLYALFLLKSIYQLKKGGRLAFIVPSEFLNSDYGIEVKRYLIKTNILRQIIVIDFRNCIFEEALTTACILLCENNSANAGIRFSKINNTEKLNSIFSHFTEYDRENIEPTVKWRKYYDPDTNIGLVNTIPFSTIAKVSRGIATGSNDYFTFSRDKINKKGIPMSAFVKCICHSTDVRSILFGDKDFEKLDKDNRRVYLFRGEGQENIEEVNKYIRYGEREGVNKKYLTSLRSPWYAIERRIPAPIWVSVFNRKGLKFIRNECLVSNLTTYHCVYPNNIIDTNVLFAYLSTNFAKEILMQNSRQYGNGLVKFEPNDLNKAQIVDLRKLNDFEQKLVLRCYSLLHFEEDIVTQSIELLDRIFRCIYTDENPKEALTKLNNDIVKLESNISKSLKASPSIKSHSGTHQSVRQLTLFS